MTKRPTLLEAAKERVLLCDGAMGTQLQAAGLEPGACGDIWNLKAPEKVLAIQSAYVAAGTDCLITNTFGASRFNLARHGHADQSYAIAKAGAELARQALGGQGWVLGDIGPFGGLLAPFGETTEEQLTEMTREQIRGLLDGSADAIIIETQTALEEAAAGVRAARDLGSPCTIVSFAFDKGKAGYRTMMGVGPADVVKRLSELGADIFGANCGTGLNLPDYVAIAKAYRSATERPIMIQPNAGRPVIQGDQSVYLETPEKMAACIAGLVDAGARIIGGCCGTTPEHIRGFRRRIDQLGS